MKKLKSGALSSIISSLMAIALGLLVGLIVLLIADAENAWPGFVAIVTGGLSMQIYGFAPQIISIITAVIIYFSAFALFFKLFLAKHLRGRPRTGRGSPPATAADFNAGGEDK